jgi:hypothetical protein
VKLQNPDYARLPECRKRWYKYRWYLKNDAVQRSFA